MEEELGLIQKTLKKYSQEHILNGFEKLDESKQKKLLEQIKNIDFDLINSLYNKTKGDAPNSEAKIEPIEYLDKSKIKGEYKEFEETGEKISSSNNGRWTRY